jgi:hypothetical protein
MVDQIRQLSPSSAVVFIREYFEEKLRDDRFVEFQYIGPSPFHADIFALQAADAERAPVIKDLTSPGDGYRTFLVELATGDDDEVREFIRAYHDIFGTFYTACSYRSASIHLASNIMRGTTDLFSDGVRKKGWNAFRRRLRQGQIIDSVFQSIIHEKMNRVELDGYLARKKESEEIDQTNPFFRIVEKEAADLYEVPTHDVKEILKMLEERRQGYFQNFATLISGLVGGLLGAAIGAILTFLFGYYISAESNRPKNANPPPIIAPSE